MSKQEHAAPDGGEQCMGVEPAKEGAGCPQSKGLGGRAASAATDRPSSNAPVPSASSPPTQPDVERALAAVEGIEITEVYVADIDRTFLTVSSDAVQAGRDGLQVLRAALAEREETVTMLGGAESPRHVAYRAMLEERKATHAARTLLREAGGVIAETHWFGPEHDREACSMCALRARIEKELGNG